MTKDQIKNYIVCINGGSGVIFQPLAEAYSYILTAKHIFKDIKKYGGLVQIHRHDPASQTCLTIPPFALIKDENYFPHPVKDLAILKVKRLNGAECLIRFDDPFRPGFSFSLFGFPQTRRDEVVFIDRIREDLNLQMSIDKGDGKREGVLEDRSTWEELVGQSGGGIFCISPDYVYLLGIQNRVPNRKEYKGRIEFSLLHNFDEIVEKSKGKLEQLIPYYVKSFTLLQKEAFNLPSQLLTETIVSKIRRILELDTAATCKGEVHPLEIIGNLGDKDLLISGQPKEDLFIKALWLLWLEMLTIISIARGSEIKKDDLDEIFKDFRVFHSNTPVDFWTTHLQDMAQSNYGDLKRNGVVIVSSAQLPHKDFYKLEKESIPDSIYEVRQNFNHEHFVPYGDEDLNTVQASEFPYDKFQFIHMAYFKQKLLIDDYLEFQQLTLQQIKDLLKEKYGKVFQ